MNTIKQRKLELENCRPAPTMDLWELNRFWDEALAQYSDHSLEIVHTPETTPYSAMDVSKISYKGYDDTPIHAWHIRPRAGAGTDNRLPCIVTFPGYTGDKGYPERYAHWVLLGYSVLAVDVRGQGGETGNLLAMDSGVVKGWVTQGITDIHRSYYMALSIDALRAVDTAAALSGVNPDQIAVVGGSQGGGLALLCGALSNKVAAVVADIPNMCRMDYGVLHSASSLSEVAQYIKRFPEQLDAILEHLAYFDMLNLAHRIKAPVMVSVGWKDTVCMPETIYAAYNRIEAPKEIRDYPFSGHETSEYQRRQTVEFLSRVLGASKSI